MYIKKLNFVFYQWKYNFYIIATEKKHFPYNFKIINIAKIVLKGYPVDVQHCFGLIITHLSEKWVHVLILV